MSELDRQATDTPSPVTERANLLTEDLAAAGTNVVHRLGREIVAGLFEPHSRLPDEATMLRRYAVSRTSLREAYSKLAAKGMIQARPKVGTTVRPPAFWNMLDPEVLNWHLQTRPPQELAFDLYTLRKMVEPAAAALAAQARSDDQLRRMTQALADMHDAQTSEGDLVEADLRFHLEILFATRNPFIGAFSALIHAAMMSTFRISWRGAEASVIKQERLQQHGEVLAAIRDQDPERARAAMQSLLDDSLQDAMDGLGQET